MPSTATIAAMPIAMPEGGERGAQLAACAARRAASRAEVAEPQAGGQRARAVMARRVGDDAAVAHLDPPRQARGDRRGRG